MVTAPPLLKYYEREKDLVIQCDPSEGGLGVAFCYLALLAHRNTHQEGFGTNPAQRLFSKKTETNLATSSNLLKPSVAEDTLEKDK